MSATSNLPFSRSARGMCAARSRIFPRRRNFWRLKSRPVFRKGLRKRSTGFCRVQNFPGPPLQNRFERKIITLRCKTLVAGANLLSGSCARTAPKLPSKVIPSLVSGLLRSSMNFATPLHVRFHNCLEAVT